MKVGFGVFREIKVDDDVDRLNIDTTSEEICANEENPLSTQPRGKVAVERTIESHLNRPSFDRHHFGNRGTLGYDVVEASLRESRSKSNPTL